MWLIFVQSKRFFSLEKVIIFSRRPIKRGGLLQWLCSITQVIRLESLCPGSDRYVTGQSEILLCLGNNRNEITLCYRATENSITVMKYGLQCNYSNPIEMPRIEI